MQSVITTSQLEYLSVESLRRKLRDPDKPTGALSEVACAGTPGSVENTPPGGEVTFGREECNLLVVDVSAPSTGQGVTGEGDVQQGAFSSVTVGFLPLSLASLPPVSPHTVQPVTPGSSSSFADQSQQKGEGVHDSKC